MKFSQDMRRFYSTTYKKGLTKIQKELACLTSITAPCDVFFHTTLPISRVVISPTNVTTFVENIVW